MEKKSSERIITEDRILQRVVLEILLNRCKTLTINEAKCLARGLSVKMRNALYEIDKGDLSLTDEQANSEAFWIENVLNAGKDFNQKPPSPPTN